MKPLTLDRLSVSLEGVRVVHDLGLEVAAGAWVALIGPNGAGKTTVLRAVAGLVAYTGLVRLFGEEASGLSRQDIARRVAFLPQSPVIPVDMTVLEYVLLGRTPHLGFLGSPGAADVRTCRSALARLDAAHLLDRRLGSLSGGERQRAVLGRALAQDARLVLLDEPTAALDVGAQQQVLELVASLRGHGNLTVLSAMHDLTVAGQYADRLVLLDGGRQVAVGTPEEVLTEELIARHYGASVRVVADPDAGIAVVPVRPRLEAEERVS